MSRHRVALCVWALLLGSTSAASALAPTPAEPSRPLPFRPLSGPQDRFAVSNLTSIYEKDPTLFLSSRGSRIDLQELDRYGHFPYGDVPLRPGEKSLVESARGRRVAELSPPEKDDLTPPSAGVQVGIPSAVAATGALIGGLAILVRILTLGI